MPQVVAFLSSIDKVFSAIPEENRFCFIDTNVLIAAFYDVHEFNEDAELVFEKFTEYKVKPLVNVTSRYEFLDFVRRVILTENLFSMIDSGSPWRISQTVKREIENAKRAVGTFDLPVLSDKKIKDIKKCFVPKRESGNHGWIEVSSFFLQEQLGAAWDMLTDALDINYFDTQKEPATTLLVKRPDWDGVTSISSHTGLSSADSMILNIFEASMVPVLVSFDYDIGYAFRARESESKALLLHDALARDINKLRFSI